MLWQHFTETSNKLKLRINRARPVFVILIKKMYKLDLIRHLTFKYKIVAKRYT